MGRNVIAVHPSDLHFLWAQGKNIVVKSVESNENSYLKGHEGMVTLITVSPNGKLVASGETIGNGQQAAVIVWSFDQLDILFRVRYHSDLVQALSFSCDEQYLLSMSGQKDGNKIVVWNMAEGCSETLSYASN